MNTKTIVIGIIVLFVVALIGYFAFVGSKAPVTDAQAQAAQQQTQNASSTDQVQGQDVQVGTGTEAKPGDKVSLVYEGRLSDGTVFDSSEMHKDPKTGKVVPLTFVLGQQGLIPGFQIGVNGMKEGGVRAIAIPPALAYGDQEIHADPNDPKSKVVIPPNSTLVFQIQLIKVEPGTQEAAQ